MEHMPTAISVAALIVAFVAVAVNKRRRELLKEKKSGKKLHSFRMGGPKGSDPGRVNQLA
jgi:hypothetical protein